MAPVGMITRRSTMPERREREQKQPEKGKMTVQEAGHMGGEAVKEKYGPEFYSEIGHQGGQKVKELIEKGEQAEERGK
ncbi:Stress-induced bacterial acidophilic repeat motif protein [compost metagenome]